jgi:hypothetical protein
VDAGSREENASNKEVEPPFRFNRNGKALEVAKIIGLIRVAMILTYGFITVALVLFQGLFRLIGRAIIKMKEAAG